jgi:hypothetical protein
MIFKNGLNILYLTLFVFLVTACFEDDNYYEDTYVSTDAEIWSFYLFHDSLPALGTVVFSIDQTSNTIYNYDSMTYLTEVPEKVAVGFVTSIASPNTTEVTNVLDITNIAEGDSVWLKQGDSVRISEPLILRVYALDQKTTKDYTVQLNIHQTDPDSVQYNKIASGSDLSFLETDETKTILYKNKFFTFSKINGEIQLYSSTNAVNWSKENISTEYPLPANTVVKGIQHSKDYIFAYTADGKLYTTFDDYANSWRLVNSEFPVKSILGFLNAGINGQLEGLSLVVEKGGDNVFAFTRNSTDWTYGEIVPKNFPLYNFSTHSYEIGKSQNITNIGGTSSAGEIQNSVWSTTNGLYWAKISGNQNVFPPLNGANAFYYNGEFWLINGRLDDGSLNTEVYYSIDRGITWSQKPEKYWTPESFYGRYSASVLVDNEGVYFYIIGGKRMAFLPEVWKGFLNKKTFAH